MARNNISILSTRNLPGWLIERAAEEGVQIDCLPFISTAAIQSVEVQQEVEQVLTQEATVIFTSANAVEAVAEYIGMAEPAWEIYCTSQGTFQRVVEYFGEKSIAGTADSAAELAELIAEEADADEVIFFCGDQRRDELPGILQQNDIDVTEIVVYQTIDTPQKINTPYSGILFFSPSAVRSFFSINKINDTVRLFAIGHTTAEAIKKYYKAEVLVSREPDKASLVDKAIDYFIHHER